MARHSVYEEDGKRVGRPGATCSVIIPRRTKRSRYCGSARTGALKSPSPLPKAPLTVVLKPPPSQLLSTLCLTVNYRSTPRARVRACTCRTQLYRRRGSPTPRSLITWTTSATVWSLMTFLLCSLPKTSHRHSTFLEHKSAFHISKCGKLFFILFFAEQFLERLLNRSGTNFATPTLSLAITNFLYPHRSSLHSFYRPKR